MAVDDAKTTLEHYPDYHVDKPTMIVVAYPIMQSRRNWVERPPTISYGAHTLSGGVGHMANVERLQHLKSILEQTKKNNPKKFKWSRWFDRVPRQRRLVPPAAPTVDFSDILNPKVREVSPFCGTTACILGLAAMDPVFNAQGLYIDMPEGSSSPSCPAIDKWEIKCRDVETYGAWQPNLLAGAAFFDLTPIEAKFLFHGGNLNFGDIDDAIACVQWLIEGRSVHDGYVLLEPRKVRRILSDEQRTKEQTHG